MRTNIDGVATPQQPAFRDGAAVMRAIFIVFAIVALTLAMPALHSAAGLDAPDALDHGFSASSALSAAHMLASVSATSVFLLGLGYGMLAARQLLTARMHARQTGAIADRARGARRCALGDRGCYEDDDPASHAATRTSGDSTTLRCGHVPSGGSSSFT